MPRKSKTLVFGASLKPNRISNMVVYRLLNHGEEVLAFGLKHGYINGIEVKTSLSDIGEVDTITLYISPKNQPQYYQDLIALKPRRVIFNPGTENPELFRILKENGIEADVSCSLTLLATNQY